MSKEFTAGTTEPCGDCGKFASYIDYTSEESSPWLERIRVLGNNERGAEFLRDRILNALNAEDSAPSWTGEGVPPVGTQVEIQKGGWRIREESECFIGATVVVRAQFRMGSGAEMIAVDGGEELGCEVFRAEMARPVRTPEQIAADERLHKLRNAHTDIARTLECFQGDIPAGSVSRQVIEAMIDAGYSKQVQP